MFKGFVIFTALLATFAVGAAPVDPTRPSAAAGTVMSTESAQQPAASRFELQGIRTQGNRRTAVINGQTVAEGGRVGSARVTRIESHQVTLIHSGKRQQLILGGALTKHWTKQD